MKLDLGDLIDRAVPLRGRISQLHRISCQEKFRRGPGKRLDAYATAQPGIREILPFRRSRNPQLAVFRLVVNDAQQDTAPTHAHILWKPEFLADARKVRNLALVQCFEQSTSSHQAVPGVIQQNEIEWSGPSPCHEQLFCKYLLVCRRLFDLRTCEGFDRLAPMTF